MTWNENLSQRCASCRYFYNGSCRRYPKINIASTQMTSNYDQKTNQYIQEYKTSWNLGYPYCDGTDWCGEWQPNFMVDKLEPTQTR